MTTFDEYYCSSVAHSDLAAACARWLQVGRDHRWAPPPAPVATSFDWQAWVPAFAAVVSVLALLLMVRGLRATRPPVTTSAMPRPGAVALEGTVVDDGWDDYTGAAHDARAEARSVSPGAW